MKLGFERAWMFFAVPLFGLVSVSSFAAEEPETAVGTVWVNVTSQKASSNTDPFMEALSVRLPGRSIRALPRGTRGGCPERVDMEALVRLAVDGDQNGRLEVISCGDDRVLLSDRISGGGDSVRLYRQAALAAAVVLDAHAGAPTSEPAADSVKNSEDDSPPDESDSVDASADLPSLNRTVARLAMAPGLAVTFGGDPLFLGSLEIGARFKNGIVLIAASDFASRLRGTAVKKNEDPSEGVEVGVTDFAFRIGVLFRLALVRRWYLEMGAGGRYTHSVTEDLSEDKYVITEETPSARGAAFVQLSVGRQWTRFFALDFRVVPAVSFGERRYTARGEEAVSFGYGSVALCVGAVFGL